MLVDNMDTNTEKKTLLDSQTHNVLNNYNKCAFV